ncbi:MAG: class I SAM-dependent methyltransferase [Parachlamydiaceae bacterium]|nr:class I SAM-dependent methyltransferase [Parachlamydiaceae bacterium]
MSKLAQQYWNEVGSKKDFEDPLYLERLSSFLTKESKIVEYGCGYGRLLQLLNTNGYQNLVGFDFAQSMIERGKNANPNLDLRLLKEPGKIPCATESVDAVIMSTVLCCMIDSNEQERLFEEILRVLKKDGVLYLSDFLICNDEKYKRKYSAGFQNFGTWGIYTTSENLVVRHLSTQNVFELLKNFDIQWFEQFDFKTMNQNPARTFHCIAKK